MIVFEKQPSINDILLSYNNNTVTFKQSDLGLTATRATVTFSGLVFTLYPDPSKKFYFNFKHAISTLINNNRNFADDADFDLTTPIALDFQTRVLADSGTFEAFDCLISEINNLGVDPILNWTNFVYKLSSVTYKIFYSNLTNDTEAVNYHFLSGYVNLQNYRTLYPNYPYLATSQLLLKPIPYFKYWFGYPFDITYYNGLLNDIEVDLITNEGGTICQKYNWGATNFYTSSGTINGTLGASISLIYNSSTNTNLVNSVKIGDTISVLNWKFLVSSIVISGGLHTFSTTISQVGTPSTPSLGTEITTCFYLISGLVVPSVFDNTNRVNRIIISNGFELQNGYNKLSLGSNEFYIEQISQYCNGHYLKWLNSFGGWNYWLFDKGNDTLTTKDLGTIYNDYNDIVDTVSPYVAIGKTSENNISVNQSNITPNELLILNDLPDSPKVYLFQGLPNDWLEVTIKSSSFRVANSKEKMTNLNLTIELPANVTKTL